MKIVADVYAWCARKFCYWFHYYVVFSKSILYMLGLVLSYQLMEKTVFSILVVLLREEDYDLPNAAIIVNLQQATFRALYFYFTVAADQYSGLFKMLICSTTLLYIIELSFGFAFMALSVLGPGLFYTALGLLTLFQAAIMATLRQFLKEQVMHKDQPTTIEEEERSNCRSDFWWNAASLLTIIVSIPLSKMTSLGKLLMVSSIAMGISLLSFVWGIKYYKLPAPPGYPFRANVFVLYTAIVRRRAPYPENPIPPQVSWLRWLDKAAVVEDEEQVPGYHLEQVMISKLLLKMSLLWPTLFTCSLVDAVGSTFFLEQAAAIKRDIPIFFFVALQRSMHFVAENVSDYVIEKYFEEDNAAQRKNFVRIGVGMVCCVLCCVTAWVNSKQLSVNPHASILVITPQVALLGLMTGFIYDGHCKLFQSQVPKSAAKYADPFRQLVMSSGALMNVCLIVLFGGSISIWMGEDILSSHLDMYYSVLLILSSVTLVLYVFVPCWYGNETFPSEDPSGCRRLTELDQELEDRRIPSLH